MIYKTVKNIVIIPYMEIYIKRDILYIYRVLESFTI